MLAALTDEELVLRFQEGTDPAVRNQCVNELFGRHQKRVALWCYRMTGDRETASDLAQDVFMRAYQNLGSFRSDAKFSTWLYTIARNHCLNFFKARKRKPEEVVEDSELFEFADLRALSPYREAERMSERQAAERLLAEALDETERRVFVLHFVEEYPLDAITRLLGLKNPPGAAGCLLQARRKLKRAVNRWIARERRIIN